MVQNWKKKTKKPFSLQGCAILPYDYLTTGWHLFDYFLSSKTKWYIMGDNNERTTVIYRGCSQGLQSLKIWKLGSLKLLVNSWWFALLTQCSCCCWATLPMPYWILMYLICRGSVLGQRSQKIWKLGSLKHLVMLQRRRKWMPSASEWPKVCFSL